MAHVIDQMRHSGASVLVTKYVNPRLADRLRLLDVPFIDTAGNAYLKFPPFFVFVRDMKPERKAAKAERPTGDKRRLNRREELLRRWVTGYSELLRPKLVIGEFATDEVSKSKTIHVGDGYWGGEVAAAKLVGHLRRRR